MDLNVIGKKLNTAKIKNLLTQDEKGIDTINIVLPKMYGSIDLSTFSFKMRAASEKNSLTEQLLIKSIHVENLNLLWTITSDFTAVSGVLALEIVGVDTSNTEIIKITADDIFVKSGVLGTYNPPTDVLENALAQMQTAVATCQALVDGMATIENSLTSKSTVNGVSVAQAALINDAVQTKASYDNIQTALDGTSIHSTIADDALIEITKIEGVTSQLVTVQNKNVLPKTNKTTQTINGITFTPNVDGSITLNGTATAQAELYLYGSWVAGLPIQQLLPVGTYTLKGTGNSAVRLFVTVDTTIICDAYATNVSYTFTEVKNITACALRVTSGTVLTNFIVYPQLELGATATTYEPFVPNSPSPGYPAVITNASNFDVVACGKNLLPKTTALTTTLSGITFTPNIDGTISINGTATASSGFFIIGSAFTGSAHNLSLNAGTYTMNMNGISSGTSGIAFYKAGTIVDPLLVSSSTPTFTLAERTHFISVRVYCNAGASYANFMFKPQLELGSTATAYEPYKSNKINISYEMPKLPNGVQNTVEQGTDGKWKFIKRIGKVILTATGTIADAKTNGQYICTIAPTGTLTGITFTMPIGATSATIYYELATPVETVIPDLYLTSYKGTTNYSTTSNPQVNSFINVKSKLWSNNYKENAEEQLFRLNIGGTNLNQNTAWLTDTVGYAFTASGWARDATTKMGNCISAKVSRTGLVTTSTVYVTGALPTNLIPCKVGDVFTVSVYFMTTDYTAIDDVLRLGFDQLDASNAYIRSTDIKPTLTENNVWRRFTHTVTITDATIKSIRSLVGIYKNGTVWMAGIKVERGYVATDWSPSPQDIIGTSCQLLLGTFASRPTTVAQKSMYLATDKAVGDVNRLTLSTDGLTWYQI